MLENKDVIYLKDYEIKCIHGVNPEEKINPQRFLFSVEAVCPFDNSSMSDNLDDTVSYAAIKKLIYKVATENQFDLIETLCSTIAHELLIQFSKLEEVKVLVKKPDAPMSGVFDYAAVSCERKWHAVYLALGSSLGNKEYYLDLALEGLKMDRYIKDIKESTRYETAPYGGVAKESFLNSCVEIKTLYSKEKLLDVIHKIEEKGNRVRDIHWGDRTLDIDIIFYDEIVYSSDELCIPHKEMHKRDFVLRPLNELCPNYLHPIYKRRVSELLNEL